MNKFCENYSTDTTKFSTLISNILKKTICLTDTGGGFNVFVDDTTQANLLAGACGLVSIKFDNTNVTTDPSDATVPNQTYFYNFWSNPNNASAFANAIYAGTVCAFTDKTVSDSSTYKLYMNNVNILIKKLFDYLVCTIYNNKYPALTDEIMENWHIFLAYNRGFGGLNTCQYCIDNYFIPNITDGQEANAGSIVRKLMGNNQFLRKWCGCCVPQTTSYTYDSKKYNFANPFTKDPKRYPLNCESICHNTILLTQYTGNNNVTIPMLNGVSTAVISPLPGSDLGPFDYDQVDCSANICVIDDISINAISYQGKGVMFNQICSGCANSNSNCICYSYGKGAVNKISGNNGKDGLGEPIIFSQYCSNAFCYEEQADGSYQQVKCNTTNPGNTGQDSGYNYNGNGVFNNLNDADVYGVDTWLIPISLICLFIIFFLGAIFTTVYKNRIVPRVKHKPNNTDFLDTLIGSEL